MAPFRRSVLLSLLLPSLCQTWPSTPLLQYICYPSSSMRNEWNGGIELPSGFKPSLCPLWQPWTSFVRHWVETNTWRAVDRSIPVVMLVMAYSRTSTPEATVVSASHP
ncbi:hypothetical protein EDB85DRAFT_1988224 [Lactarius pseudohatsudake]|nr:hypothetical protein EDB85DRAFT_1988224 [Lactarius pseudohatsudake]